MRSDVSDARNARRPVQTVRSLLQTSVHILIMTNVQTVVHVKKHARDTLFFKYSLNDPAEEFSFAGFLHAGVSADLSE